MNPLRRRRPADAGITLGPSVHLVPGQQPGGDMRVAEAVPGLLVAGRLGGVHPEQPIYLTDGGPALDARWLMTRDRRWPPPGVGWWTLMAVLGRRVEGVFA